MKKVLVIFNPTAGLKSKTDVEGIVRNKLKQLNYDIDLFYLNRDFEDNIENYDFSKVNLVVAVGGDGTVKVAVRTIINSGVKMPLAIIPFGSANVVAMAAQIPTNIKGSLKLLDNLDNIIAIDVGVINKKNYFLVGVSIGYVSRIVAGTTKGLKNKFGFLGYLFIFIFNKIKIKKIKFEIKTKNKTFWVKGNSLIVFNTLNYFGIKTKKVISFNDGILNLYVFTNKTFLSLIEAFSLMILFNKPPRYVFSIDNNYFKIILKHNKNACQIDGDYIKLPKIIEVELLPKYLIVITGKKNDKEK